MSQDKVRLLCGGTKKVMEGNWRGIGVWSGKLANTEQTPPTLVRTLKINELTVAANNRLKGHLLLKYMESYIEPKDENWFLRICYYSLNSFVLSVYIRAYCFVFYFITGLSSQIWRSQCCELADFCSAIWCRVVWYEVTIFAKKLHVFISQKTPVTLNNKWFLPACSPQHRCRIVRCKISP
jgi:hypothetical protein